MTKQEAIQAMKNGKKVRHRYFTSDEYLYIKDGYMYDERGDIMDNEFWWLRTRPEWDEDWYTID